MQKRWIALIMAAVMSVPIRLLSAGRPEFRVLSDCSTRLEVGGFQERRIDSVRLLFSSRENHWPFASGTFRKLSRTGICFSGPCIRC